MRQGKADIHIHTDFSDGFHDPETIINYAFTHTDLDVIAITDHNTIDGAKHAYDYWQHHRNDFARLEVIKGIEVTSSEGHILGLFLEEDIPKNMSPADTVKAIHEQGGLAIAAHPFTHLLEIIGLTGIGKEIGELPLDGVEVRNSVPVEIYSNWITAEYNRRHRNHPALGSSDTHYFTMMGKTFTNFPGNNAAEFRQCLKAGKVQPGGHVHGIGVPLQVMQHLIRRRQLPVFLPNDRQYRHQIGDIGVEVDELRHTPIAVLLISGQVTRGDNADLLKAEIMRMLDGGLRYIAVDLEAVEFIDSAGLGALVAGQQQAGKRGGKIALFAPNKNVMLTIKMVRLDKAFDIFKKRPDAISAFRRALEGKNGQ